MRYPQLCGAAAVICLSLAAPAFAQEAGDCDMICRLKGYLTTDHMAAAAEREGFAAAPAKASHRRAAPVPRAAAPKAAVAAPSRLAIAKAPESRTAAEPGGQGPAPAKREATRTAPVRTATVVLPPPAPARAAVPVASRPAPARPTPGKLATATPKAPKPASAAIVATNDPSKVRVAAAPHRAARVLASPLAAPTRTASLATAIPGSAPAMQAGFH